MSCPCFGIAEYLIKSSESVEQNQGETLITLHAEDAFLPGILAILARESGIT